MKSAPERPFWHLDEADMSTLAAIADERLSIGPDDLPAVEENLRVLLGHARILAAAMGDRLPDGPPSEAFEP